MGLPYYESQGTDQVAPLGCGKCARTMFTVEHKYSKDDIL